MSSINDVLTTRRRLIRSAAVAAPVVAVGALGVRGASVALAQDATPTPGTVTVETKLRVLHVASDLGKVEVHINGDEKLDEFNYGDLGDWMDIDPGSAEVLITVDRAGFNYAIFNAVYPVPAGNYYTLVISDPVIIGGVVDRTPIVDQAARVRVTQASVELPAVNVTTSAGAIDLGTKLTYPQKSAYASVPAGTVDVKISLADGSGDIATISGIALSGNTVYDLVIHGDLNSSDHPITITAIDAGTSAA